MLVFWGDCLLVVCDLKKLWLGVLLLFVLVIVYEVLW